MVGKRNTRTTRKQKGRSVLRDRKLRDVEPTEIRRAPHSFVLHRGTVGPYVKYLVKDFRKIMEPFTASSLKVSKKNKMRDFSSVAGLFNVSHCILFTRTRYGMYLRVARHPRGPTLSFRVHNYTLVQDIASSSKKYWMFPKQFDHSPLIVLNGFSGSENHFKLMTATFQNMFPTIDLFKVDLSTIRRCMLFNYDAATKLIDVRHYGVKVVPTGLSKGVKKLLVKKVPDLSQYNDVADFIQNPTLLSESEAEDDKTNQVVLPQMLSSRGNMASSTSAIRLFDIGPRLTLQLLKAQKGFLSGDVLFHDYIKRTEAEIRIMKKKIQSKIELKDKRRKIQEENVRKKKVKKAAMEDESHKIPVGRSVGNGENETEEEEDDSEWFKTQVGEEPEAGLFPENRGEGLKRKKSPTRLTLNKKAKKISFGTGPNKGKLFKKKPFKKGKGK